MKTCDVCGLEKKPGMTTCGRSECQQVSYLLNQTNGMRQGKKRRAIQEQADKISADIHRRIEQGRAMNAPGRWHIIHRECETGGCRSGGGLDWTSVYPGMAQAHPEAWPVVTCVDCGRDMAVTRVTDVRPDSELARAMERIPNS